jgi:molybdate/tungstate transport system substrate-binding protein
MAAGSLNHAFENGLTTDESDAGLEIEAHGSVTVARLVAEGKRNPDIVALADAALFDGPLHPTWHVEFATNALVLAYNPDTAAGRRLASAGPDDWYQPLLRTTLRLGRTDPDLDPLGYRTLFALDLASRYHGVPGLSERLLTAEQIYPETALISQFEVGAIDAAFAYRSMATARGYAFVELPPQINLSDPAFHRNWYQNTTYRLPDGKVVRGGVISYASTIRHSRPEVRALFRRQCRGAYLTAFGFSVPDDYPRLHGDVPARIASSL